MSVGARQVGVLTIDIKIGGLLESMGRSATSATGGAGGSYFALLFGGYELAPSGLARGRLFMVRWV